MNDNLDPGWRGEIELNILCPGGQVAVCLVVVIIRLSDSSAELYTGNISVSL